jgi:hypothetical protein
MSFPAEGDTPAGQPELLLALAHLTTDRGLGGSRDAGAAFKVTLGLEWKP